ncbi:MAG: sigma-54-dependent Fis family transcriptional regulator [Flavobacteriales bacterium]|nr:sigma-54-dependent Fis family transcriptional regulator [Flavobacteriales bacterium]
MDLQAIKQRFGIIGNSPKINLALETAAKVAPTDITVYIQGESGVGKESFSKIIHQLSNRKHGPFISINCGAIPEGTINSELFGHEKGSFTGANESRKGYFETVNGGTIFLDEVGELPFETQARLLRILENGEFIRVGSSKVQKTDVRVVTATNKDLLALSQQGKFREDLYYRLCTLPIHVPPLRERPSDIPILFRKFAADAGEKYHIRELELTPEAEKLLSENDWPGNIRQLKNMVEQMSVLEQNRVINEQVLEKYLPKDTKSYSLMLSNEAKNQGINERELFYKVLFDLKRDMNDLKGIVIGLLENQQSGNSDFIERNRAALTRIIPGNEGGKNTELSDIVVQGANNNVSKPYFQNDKEEYEIEELETFPEEENLSLGDKEEEMIRKALNKNNGKRKKAANDLGISERTLYRKIKEFGLN